MHSIIVFHYNSSFVELQAHRLSSCNKMHWQRNSRMSLLNRWGGRSELDSNLLLMCVGQKCTTAYSVSLMWRLLWRTWRTRKTRPLPQTLLPQVIHDRPSLNILLLCYLRQFKCKGLFLKMGQPGLFFYFRSFQTQILQKKTVGFSGIRTRIVGLEGDHADHLTTTTAMRRVVCQRPKT